MSPCASFTSPKPRNAPRTTSGGDPGAEARRNQSSASAGLPAASSRWPSIRAHSPSPSRAPSAIAGSRWRRITLSNAGTAVLHACSTAVPAFESVIRRQREPAIAEGAREGLGLCALIEGQRLLAAGKPADAEDWFRRASAPGSPPDVVRSAFLGLGDVKLAQGDIPDALENYQQAIAGGTPGDTIAQRAHEKINAVGKADAPSTTPPKSP